MYRTTFLMMTLMVALVGCNREASDPPKDSVSGQAQATVAVATNPLDAELEELKAVQPVDACAWLTPEKLATVFPGRAFEVHQHLKPQMSGYAWESRCEYWAGRGSVEYAKDVPTHTIQVFVETVASEAKAKERFARRTDGVASTTGYEAQPALGENAYAVTGTGYAKLFFVRGQSEVQITYSDLDTPSAEKVRLLVSLAKFL